MVIASATTTEVTYEEKKTEKKVKSNNYFDVREEEAVKAYIIAETKYEKEIIYICLAGYISRMQENRIQISC